MFRAQRSSGKRGLIALEALIGTILSVIALVFLFQMFADIIFSTPSNLKIVENNAQNILEFTQMPENNNFDSYNNCFFSMRMNHLENFQYQEDNKNYFYVLKDDGIYSGKLENLINFKDEWKDKSSSKLIKKEVSLNNINLKNDITKSPFPELEVFFIKLNYFFGTSEYIDLNDYDNYIVIFYPLFNDIDFGGVIKSPNNQNEYNVEIFEDNNFKKIDGSNLYYANSYKGDKNILFFDKTSYTNLLAKEDLCSRKYLNELLISKSFSAIGDLLKKSIDYINKKITFEFPIQGVSQEIVYEGGNVICSFDCSSYFENNLNDISYHNFLIGVNKIFKKVETGEKITSLDSYITSIEESNKKSNLVEFRDISGKLNINDNKKEFNFQNFFGFNSKINGCDSDNCNLIFYQNARLYFMIYEISNVDYYTFYEYFFRKSNNNEIIPTKVLLGNKEYNVEKLKIDGKGNGLTDEDKDIYIIKNVEIYFNNKKIIFDDYLTRNQLKNIKHTSEYGGNLK